MRSVRATWVTDYWMLADYLPEVIDDDRRRFPAVARIARLLGGARVEQVGSLAADLASGAWDERHGHLRRETGYRGPLVLVISRPHMAYPRGKEAR